MNVIQPQWKLESSCLEALLFPEDYTENITEMVAKAISVHHCADNGKMTFRSSLTLDLTASATILTWLSQRSHRVRVWMLISKAATTISQGPRGAEEELKAKQGDLRLPLQSLIHECGYSAEAVSEAQLQFNFRGMEI